MSIKHAEFGAAGSIAAASITNAYQTILTTTRDADSLLVFNSLDSTVNLTVPGGDGLDNFKILAGRSFVLDAFTNNSRFKAGAFQIKHDGASPTTGIFTITPMF